MRGFSASTTARINRPEGETLVEMQKCRELSAVALFLSLEPTFSIYAGKSFGAGQNFHRRTEMDYELARAPLYFPQT